MKEDGERRGRPFGVAGLLLMGSGLLFAGHWVQSADAASDPLEGLRQALEKNGWTARKDAEGSMLLYPLEKIQVQEAQPTVGTESSAEQAALKTPQAKPSSGGLGLDSGVLHEKLREAGWQVERGNDGGLILSRPVPAETRPAANDKPETGDQFESLQRELESHGWSARKDAQGNMLLTPPEKHQVEEALPEISVKSPAQAPGLKTPSATPRTGGPGLDSKVLHKKLREQGWQVEQDSDGGLILRRTVPAETKPAALTEANSAAPNQPQPAIRAVVKQQPKVLLDEDADGVPDDLDLCVGSAPGQAVDFIGCPQGEAIILTGIRFRTGSSALAESSKLRLADNAAVLRQHSKVQVQVIGHTDSVGSEANNLRLSQRRAESVRTFLVSQGLAADQVSAKGLGETQPIASNKTADGRASNRRVELRVVRKL